MDGQATTLSYPAVRRARARDLPADRTAGNRLLVLLLFWSMLAASVAVWWFGSGSIVDQAGVFTAVGRVTGMLSGFILLIQVLMMSRVSWLEEWIGAGDLLAWHRQLGPLLLILVLTHTATLIVGYALSDGVSVGAETWTMLTTYEDMISAFIATGILVAVSLLAIRALRRRLPYEVWLFLHKTSYLVLLLGYGHQFASGEQLIEPGFASWFWTVLHLLVVACLVWGRVVEPAWFNLRHQLRVAGVVRESGDMFSIYLTGKRLRDVEARAGQFFRWRFLHPRCALEAHPFSLSAAPNAQWLRLTVCAVGDHTGALRWLSRGTRVLVTGPYGHFTADRRTKPKALLIAAGSGIAPVRAVAEDMPPGTVLIYRARSAEETLFHTELDQLAWQRGIEVHYVLGSRDNPKARRVLTPGGLTDMVPDVADRDVYLCGPPGLTTTVLKTLHRLGVPARQVHVDPFEF